MTAKRKDADQKCSTRVVRIDVRPTERAGDPIARALVENARELGWDLETAASAAVYLIESDLDDETIDRVTRELLVDPVLERLADAAGLPGSQVVEIHPLPGVMDPPALTIERAIRDLLELDDRVAIRVATARRYDLVGTSRDDANAIARRLLANTVVQGVHVEPWAPTSFPSLPPADQSLRHVEIGTLDDAGLERLSRDGHLFLSLDEMRAIRSFYQEAGREPTDIELETLAQTWSEHCVHKTLKSTITITPPADDAIDWSDRPGHTRHADGSITIDNLLKSTVAAATFELIEEGVDWTRSVFVDNAGIIAFDDAHCVCVKVETHNHPSAIEPYGGAATGIGGCIRDIIGTGLGAKPIASTDVFCVAPFDADVPAGCLPPRRVLREVVRGVRDYGNRMGIPTVNGAVFFDERYIGNPLVYCGCVGVMPNDATHGDAKPGDRIIALGGRTGRDGIHGATFSSAELTDSHADEFSHAVQIGNAIEEKRTLDAILHARDHGSGCLFSAITDCGAGGFSSAVGEMGEALGAEVYLDRAPLKYDGLRYDEVWISESQERMVLAVPEANLEALRAICDEEHVEMADLGTFGTPERELVLHFDGTEVGRLPMAFLHDGIPMPTRHATWTPAEAVRAEPDAKGLIKLRLFRLLTHPDIASKRSIIRQYDHEVQGNTVVKPLVGRMGEGPGDAAVIQPVPGSSRGLAIGCGMATRLGHPDEPGSDPYKMALAAIDECVRNLVCVGADPSRIAILDNFCWPSCAKPENLGSLVRAAEGCYDGAKAYRTPFVSGKDSLNNQFRTEDGRTIEIPPTLLITGIGIVEDVDRCVTMDAKPVKGSRFVLVEPSGDTLTDRVRTARYVADQIADGRVLAAHDASEGGVLVALAEMLLASAGIGARCNSFEQWFDEREARYVLQVTSDTPEHASVRITTLAEPTTDEHMYVGGESIDVRSLHQAFTTALAL
ncbi:MAG: phosphoribosylformylglycinamidine synthase subunit PurS [Planctomycetota bacterium]